MTIAASDSPAARPRILIVEDNHLTAKAVCDIDGAIVDVSLNGRQSFPLCAELTRRKVPFCFLAEEDHGAIIPAVFRGTPLVTKPLEPSRVKSAQTALVQPGSRRGNRLLQRLGLAAVQGMDRHGHAGTPNTQCLRQGLVRHRDLARIAVACACSIGRSRRPRRAASMALPRISTNGWSPAAMPDGPPQRSTSG